MKKRAKAALSIFLSFLIIIPGVVMASAFSPRVSAPESSNVYYYGSKSHFTIGQCTWYAYGRAYEINGTAPRINSGDAGTWWNQNKTNGYYAYGDEPALGAWACYSNHVAVVEEIEDGVAYVSEANFAGTTFHYGRVAQNLSGQTFYGYIYISGEPESDPEPEPEISVTFSDIASSQSASKYSVTQTNAVLVTTVTKTAGAKIEQAGMTLTDSDGAVLATYSFTPDVAADAVKFDIVCDINADTGLTLSPSKTYKYSFFAKTDKKDFTSSTYSFKTVELEKYTVSFDANSGTNAPDDVIKTEGIDLVLPSAIPEKTGYAFSGWATSATAKRAEYHAGDKYTEDADATLYAVWEKIDITAMTIDKDRAVVSVGGTLQLEVSFEPAGAYQSVSWESTNTDAATVSSDGEVKGISEGKTTVIARAGSFYAKCVVEVTEGVELEELRLVQKNLTLKEGETAKLNYSVTPLDATDVDISWRSSDESVATVSSSGTVTAVSSGSCTIYCEDEESGAVARCEVKVTVSWFDVILKSLSLFAKLFTFFLDLALGI